MDNITHSFTGAAVSKYLSERTATAAERKSHRRTLFWLIVGCANLPDIDVFLGFWLDPITATQQHRGLSHAILFAPILALLPAALWFWLSKVRDFRLLWSLSLLGIYLHILFDLITSYGTQILQPFSSERYTLDLMFIIDPWFTVPLGILLLLSKIRKSREYSKAGAAYMISYLLLLVGNHVIASTKLDTSNEPENRSVLPQPLSPFRWMGLTRYSTGVEQVFLSNLGGEARKRVFLDSSNQFTQSALSTREGSWCFSFSRFPHVESEHQGDTVFVKIYDMQFAFDEQLAQQLGLERRDIPFAMEFNYSPDKQLRHIRFNGRTITGSK